MKTKVIIIAAVTLITVLLTGCAARGMSGEKEAGYQQISQEEAASMMEKDYGHIILDVRRRDEYASGHIPGAICIPNETITTDMLPQLPDPEQVILVYCRSGNRSKQASGKLAENEKEESEEELRARIGDLAFEVTQHAATEYAFRGQ